MTALQASGTAVLMCQSRAVADGRAAVGQFADPIATRLLRAEEQTLVRLARQGFPPSEASRRLAYRLLVGSADVAVPRTVAIDNALRARVNPQLVILGAGLDARACWVSTFSDASQRCLSSLTSTSTDSRPRVRIQT